MCCKDDFYVLYFVVIIIISIDILFSTYVIDTVIQIRVLQSLCKLALFINESRISAMMFACSFILKKSFKPQANSSVFSSTYKQINNKIKKAKDLLHFQVSCLRIPNMCFILWHYHKRRRRNKGEGREKEKSIIVRAKQCGKRRRKQKEVKH